MKSAVSQLSYGASRGAPRSGGWARRAAPTPTPSLHHARRSAAAAAAAASGDGGASSSSSSAGTATATLAPPPPSPDATAQIMNAAVEFSLRARLKAYDLIRVNVDCDARGVLEGEFRSMAIAGAGWETPLGMTARRLEVAIRGLSVDYGVLVLRRKVALKGPPPKGYTTITLNARDLGAFTQHPLFKRAAAAAVKVRCVGGGAMARLVSCSVLFGMHLSTATSLHMPPLLLLRSPRPIASSARIPGPRI